MNANFLGEGVAGKVSRKTLPCEDGREPPTGYVTKIMKQEDAAAEMEKVDDLGLERFRDFVIYPEFACKGETGWHVYSRYGGETLAAFYDQIYANYYEYEGHGLPRDIRTKLKTINVGLLRLASQVEQMNKAGVYHNDIHMQNVVIDDAGQLRLIDFGEASRVPFNNGKDKDDMKYIINGFQFFEDQFPQIQKGGRRRSKKTRRRRSKNLTSRLTRMATVVRNGFLRTTKEIRQSKREV
jgi:hypothetical protein